MDGYEDLSALTDYSRVPIAGGELHSSGLPELKMMIEKRCYDVFQPDAIFTGGIAQTIEVARLCREHGLGYSPHTWTNGIGFAVNLQLFAASGFAAERELEYPLAPPGGRSKPATGSSKSPSTTIAALSKCRRPPVSVSPSTGGPSPATANASSSWTGNAWSGFRSDTAASRHRRRSMPPAGSESRGRTGRQSEPISESA